MFAHERLSKKSLEVYASVRAEGRKRIYKWVRDRSKIWFVAEDPAQYSMLN